MAFSPSPQVRPTPGWIIEVPSGPREEKWGRAISTYSELLIRHTVFGGRGEFLVPSDGLTAEKQLVVHFLDSARQAEMLRVVTPLLQQM